MDDALGCGDDSLWNGLACLPLDGFAFNFDETCNNLDCILDDPLLEGEIEEEYSITTNVRTRYGKGKQLNLVEQVLKVEKPRITSYDCQLMNQVKSMTGLDHTNEVDGFNKRTTKVAVMRNKSNHCYGNFGKGKELKLNLNMAEIEAFLEEEIEEVVEKKDKKRKIMHDDDCRPVQRKDRRLNPTNLLVVVDNKRIDDFDLRLEPSGHKLHESHESTGQPMQRKNVKRLDDMNRLGVVDNKRKASSDERLEGSRHMNELAVAEKMRQADYDLKFEATTHKLHEINEKLREVKQQKKIQVIDFKKLVTEQPIRCTAKSKGKSSLRQRLMATGTHKSNKKFHPFAY